MLAKIDVQEAREKQNLNTAGGDAAYKRLGGPGGLPYFAFLDAHGDVIVNSIRPGDNGKKGENIGHPDSKEEVDLFLAMVHKAAPKITPAESAALERWLRNQKKP